MNRPPDNSATPARRAGSYVGLTVFSVLFVVASVGIIAVVPAMQSSALRGASSAATRAHAKAAASALSVTAAQQRLAACADALRALQTGPGAASAEAAQARKDLAAAQRDLDAAIRDHATAATASSDADIDAANESQALDMENKLRLTIVQAVGGLLVLLTAAFTGLNWWIAREKLALDLETAETSLESAEKSLEVARAGLQATHDKQLSERFVKATENLGSSRFEARLGAIYSLERLARDSDSDHPTVLRVLAGFVRIASRKTAAAADGSDAGALPRLPDDIQAALTAITRRNRQPDEPSVDLREAVLISADLTFADLAGAQLLAVDCRSADMKEARFAGANLNGANLRGADLSSADLTGATLQNAEMTDAILDGALLIGADLSDANLHGARMAGTVLTNARLDRAELSDADLTDAVGLTQEQLRPAFANDDTRLPAGLRLPRQQSDPVLIVLPDDPPPAVRERKSVGRTRRKSAKVRPADAAPPAS